MRIQKELKKIKFGMKIVVGGGQCAGTGMHRYFGG